MDYFEDCASHLDCPGLRLFLPPTLTPNDTCRHCFHRIKGNAPTGRERRSPVTIRIEKE